MYPLEMLKDMAKPYLENNDSILVTDDGQFFYNSLEGRTFSKNYAFRKKVKVWLVTAKEIVQDKVLDEVGVNTDKKKEPVSEKVSAAKAAKEAEKAAVAAKKTEEVIPAAAKEPEKAAEVKKANNVPGK
jgi:hypothetical protein